MCKPSLQLKPVDTWERRDSRIDRSGWGGGVGDVTKLRMSLVLGMQGWFTMRGPLMGIPRDVNAFYRDDEMPTGRAVREWGDE